MGHPTSGASPDPGPRTPQRIVVLADLAGDDRYHVGDEAMAETTVSWLRSLYGAQDVHLTVASADPEATAARLGCDAVPWVGLADLDPDQRRRRMATLLAGLDAGPGGPPPPALVEAVTGADALVIAGGGNLNSSWPGHVHERALASALARRRGAVVVVTGQTLGPFDTDEERDAVATLLSEAAVVGVREPHSAVEARQLGVDDARLVEAPDDALLIEPRVPATLPAGFDAATTGAHRRVLAVTIHPFAPRGDPRYARLAEQLAVLAQRVGASLLMVPHVRHREPDTGLSDTDVAVDLAERTGGSVLHDPEAPEAAWASQRAWLVVSSRYHPLVFATAAATPALALTWGHYTSVKCRGALGQVGCEPWWVDLGVAAEGRLVDAAGELARRHSEVAAWMGAFADEVRQRDAWRRWRIASALGVDCGPEPLVSPSPMRGRTDAPVPAGEWAATRA